MNVPCGREHEAQLFKNIIQNDRISQAYILCAPEGMGKRTLTHYILSLLLCDTHSSCGICPSCKSLEMNCHPDVVYLKKDEDKASLSVDNVRDIKTEVYTKPKMSAYKAVVAENMELATTQAQNAMLKMIEEPPEKVVFFMLTSNMAPILPTISSRSVSISLKPLSFEALKKISGADDHLVSLCGGNIGTLLRLTGDEDFADFRDEVADAFFSVTPSDAYSPYSASQKLDKYKSRANEVLEALLSLSRDVYFYSVGLKDKITNKDKMNYIQSLSSSITEDKAGRIVEHITQTISQRGTNGNFSMAVTTLLLKCQSEMK